ncbi:unnamed protein product [Pylaiella littoralis]
MRGTSFGSSSSSDVIGAKTPAGSVVKLLNCKGLPKSARKGTHIPYGWNSLISLALTTIDRHRLVSVAKTPNEMCR